jgi:hypothetical protein
MAQLTLPVGKQEFYDGTNWFSLASENWVTNNFKTLSPCFIATTSNLTAVYSNGTSGVGATLTNSGTQAIFSVDNVTPAVNDRVLVKNQTSAFQNGIYVVTTLGSASTNWVLTRTTDYDVKAQMIRGDVISVISGDVNNTSLWMMTSIVNTIGTDAINFGKTDQNTFTSIVGTANQINVSVAGGIATLSIVTNPVLPGNGSVTLPTGTTVQRPNTPTVGMFRFNTSL